MVTRCKHMKFYSPGMQVPRQVMTGNKPDVRYLFRFGSLCRVLLPLEKRQHKFHTYTEDCCYLGPCPLGKGTRFLRIINMQTMVRDDCVVYGDILPFRSVGGKGAAVKIGSKSAAWDDVHCVFPIRESVRSAMGVYRSLCLLVCRFINRDCSRKRFCTAYLSPDATSVSRLCVEPSASLWLPGGRARLRPGSGGSPAAPHSKLR